MPATRTAAHTDVRLPVAPTRADTRPRRGRKIDIHVWHKVPDVRLRWSGRAAEYGIFEPSQAIRNGTVGAFGVQPVQRP